MCNFIVPIFPCSYGRNRIRKSGHGYKWMFKTPEGRYISPFKGGSFEKDETYVWNDLLYRRIGDGFTFFLSKREALNANEVMKRALYYDAMFVLTLVKISYKQGLCSRHEPDPMIDCRIGLCEEFTIISEVELAKEKKI